MDDDGYFGERVAARYDESAADSFAPAVVVPTVDLLAELARGGRALELGIGTGRIALPLAARGLEVHGIELSRAMVERLRAKPGGDRIDVTIGDFATTRVPGTFSLAYVVFNTIENLTTQEAQVACFRNVAAHLEPGGSFLVEVDVPPLRWLAAGETMRVFHASDAHWGIDEVDVARQGVVSHHFEQVEGRFQRLSMPLRYAWPAELDLMAELAGMTLAERVGRLEPGAVHGGEPEPCVGLAKDWAACVAGRGHASARVPGRGSQAGRPRRSPAAPGRRGRRRRGLRRRGAP